MNRNTKINLLLLCVVVALAVLPLALGLGDHKEEPFTGADAEAETAITEIEPDYEPWFSPLYEPPSGEIESALFSLQAALGAGVLAYYFGVHRGRRQGEARARAQLDGAEDTPATAETADAAETAGAAEAAEAVPVSSAVATTTATVTTTAAVTATAAAKTPPGDGNSSGASGNSPAGQV